MQSDERYIRDRFDDMLENVQAGLRGLRGEEISDVYYHSAYEGYEHFDQLLEQVNEVPCQFILLQTVSGKFFTVAESYEPYLRGIGHLTISQAVSDPYGRANHIHDRQWQMFRRTRITDDITVKDIQIVRGKEYPVAFCIGLKFHNGHSLYIANAGIKRFNEEEARYDLVRGQLLTIFFSDMSARHHDVLKGRIDHWLEG